MGEVFYLTVAALVVCAVLEYRDENQVFRLFLPGLLLSAAGIGAASLLSGLRPSRYVSSLSHAPAWDSFCMTV